VLSVQCLSGLIVTSVYGFKLSYPEWRRDWPDEARQPFIDMIDCIYEKGANSCRMYILRDKKSDRRTHPLLTRRGFFILSRRGGDILLRRVHEETEVGSVNIGTLELESGTMLSDVHLVYERSGRRDGPMVLVEHALTGNHRTIGSEQNPGWWRGLIGPGRSIDTRYFQVLTFNVLGGSDGSTGPQSIRPGRTEPYGTDFPFITIRDMVNAEYQALRIMGIDHVYAIIGGSLGGMRTLEWTVMYPEMMDVSLPLAVTPKLSAYGIAFNALARQAIMSDPAWQNGRYQASAPPRQGMMLARMAGMLTYRTGALLEERFDREEKDGWGRRHEEVAFQVESYLLHHGRKLAERFDANSYLYLLKAMDAHDLMRNRSSEADVLDRIKARLIAIAYTGDLIYPPDALQSFIRRLKERGVRASFFLVPTQFGHDGFLTEFDVWGWIIREALDFRHHDAVDQPSIDSIQGKMVRSL